MSIHVLIKQLEIAWRDVCDGGGLDIVELSPPDPWLSDPKDTLELDAGEATVS